MQKFETVKGNAIPLNRADVDTDQIIPAQYLKRIERSGFGPFAFETCTLASTDEVAHAIRAMLVRGAPLIGVTAAFGHGTRQCRFLVCRHWPGADV